MLGMLIWVDKVPYYNLVYEVFSSKPLNLGPRFWDYLEVDFGDKQQVRTEVDMINLDGSRLHFPDERLHSANWPGWRRANKLHAIELNRVYPWNYVFKSLVYDALQIWGESNEIL